MFEIKYPNMRRNKTWLYLQLFMQLQYFTNIFQNYRNKKGIGLEALNKDYINSLIQIDFSLFLTLICINQAEICPLNLMAGTHSYSSSKASLNALYLSICTICVYNIETHHFDFQSYIKLLHISVNNTHCDIFYYCF